MKWFLALIIGMNLFVAAIAVLRQHEPVEIHSHEVSPQSLKLLPASWMPPAEASVPITGMLNPSWAASDVVSTMASVPRRQASAPAAKGEQRAASDKKMEQTALRCLQWSKLSASQLLHIRDGLKPVALAQHQMIQTDEAVDHKGAIVRYWVYNPELANGAATQALSAELQANVVQNDSDFKGALSLGLFVKREAAERLLKKLKVAGYERAAIRVRGQEQDTTLTFTHLNAHQYSDLQALQERLLPSIALKDVACPAR